MEDIPPPPDLFYNSYEEALDALKNHGMQHGYGFVLKRSWPHNSTVKIRYYHHCDRFRKNYQSSAKTLSTSTRSTGCPFKLVIFKPKQGSQWKLEVQTEYHNHPRSINPSAHNIDRSPFEQGVHPGGTKHQLAEIHLLSNNTCRPQIHNSSPIIKPRDKHLLKLFSKSIPLSLFRFPRLLQVHIL